MSEVVEYKGYITPKDRRYSKDHMWIKIVEGKKARIGITDFAQKKLKSIVFVEAPEVGKEFEAGETITTIESLKAVGEIIAPVKCKVVGYNQKLDDDPGLINKDPYGEGWIVEVEVEDPAEIEKLMTAEEYVENVVKKEA